MAAVVADDRYRAEDGAEGVDVEYEPLPRHGLRVGRPGATPRPRRGAGQRPARPRTFDAGDVEAALAEAAVVVDRELTTNRHGGNPIECRAGVALYEVADRAS